MSVSDAQRHEADAGPSGSMQAVVLRESGPAENLRLESVPLPACSNVTDVRVRVVAAGVNPVDAKVRQAMAFFPDGLPAILGCDGAGVVESVGAAVTRVRPGDRVAFCHGGLGREAGSYAQYTLVPESLLAKVPAGVELSVAAALPLAWITQEEALFDRAGLQSGETLLVLGGAGGVGHLAIQRARLAGARVLATARNAQSAADVEALGAEVLRLDRDDWQQDLDDMTHGRGPDCVFDCVGPPALCPLLPQVAVYGRVVTLLQAFCGCAEAEFRAARLRNVTLHHCLMLTPALLGLDAVRVGQRERVEAGLRLVAEGRIDVRVAVSSLAEVVRVHRQIESGTTRGKCVLQVWPDER